MAKQANDGQQSYSAWIHTQKVIRTIVCVILCFLSIIPFYIMIVNATRDTHAIERGQDDAKFFSLKLYTVIPYAVKVEKYTCNSVAGTEIRQELNKHDRAAADETGDGNPGDLCIHRIMEQPVHTEHDPDR